MYWNRGTDTPRSSMLTVLSNSCHMKKRSYQYQIPIKQKYRFNMGNETPESITSPVVSAFGTLYSHLYSWASKMYCAHQHLFMLLMIFWVSSLRSWPHWEKQVLQWMPLFALGWPFQKKVVSQLVWRNCISYKKIAYSHLQSTAGTLLPSGQLLP